MMLMEFMINATVRVRKMILKLRTKYHQLNTKNKRKDEQQFLIIFAKNPMMLMFYEWEITVQCSSSLDLRVQCNNLQKVKKIHNL